MTTTTPSFNGSCFMVEYDQVTSRKSLFLDVFFGLHSFFFFNHSMLSRNYAKIRTSEKELYISIENPHDPQKEASTENGWMEV